MTLRGGLTWARIGRDQALKASLTARRPLAPLYPSPVARCDVGGLADMEEGVAVCRVMC